MILFGGTHMYTAKNYKLKALISEVEQYNREYMLKLDIEDAIEFLVSKHRFEVPVLDFDGKTIVDEGAHGTGVYIKLAIPFKGSPEVLAIQPTTAQSGSPDAEITGSDIRILYKGSESRSILGDIDRSLNAIEVNLRFAAIDLQHFDTELRNRARQALAERKAKFQNNLRVIDELGIPKLQRETSPPTYPAPELRRKPPISSIAPIADQPSEPTVELAEYDHILEVISGMVKVMERSPATFAHMGEENIRDILLVNLNGHYQGQATGETFNLEGKTDILVRAKNANLFIAECKFWEGPKGYHEAIDQLLGYVTWRDTKTAIIIFNRRKNFGAVLKQIPETTKEHKHYKSTERYPSETGFRFIFRNATDSSKSLFVTVIAFDVPAATES